LHAIQSLSEIFQYVLAPIGGTAAKVTIFYFDGGRFFTFGKKTRFLVLTALFFNLYSDTFVPLFTLKLPKKA
jgi:hypothetical protein